MSRSIGAQLPETLRAALAGTDPEAALGRTFQLLTSAADGNVSVALLSAGEILAVGPDHLRLALWPVSTTTANLSRSSHGTLVSIEPDGVFYIRLATRRLADLRAGGMDHAAFDAIVEDVLEDEVTYARMTSGVRFELTDGPATVRRWRATLAALDAHPA
jgi:hypothetical protein